MRERQSGLFDEPDASHRLARSSHPSTSHESARDLVDSGALNRGMRMARAVLLAHPGSTARELDQYADSGDGAVRKRLNDLRREGLAHAKGRRVCSVSNKPAQLWYPGKQTY